MNVQAWEKKATNTFILLNERLQYSEVTFCIFSRIGGNCRNFEKNWGSGRCGERRDKTAELAGF